MELFGTTEAYPGIFVRSGRQGLFEITVNQPIEMVRPHSKKVTRMVPGDTMHVDMEGMRMWREYMENPPTIARCLICGTRTVLGTKCPNYEDSSHRFWGQTSPASAPTPEPRYTLMQRIRRFLWDS